MLIRRPTENQLFSPNCNPNRKYAILARFSYFSCCQAVTLRLSAFRAKLRQRLGRTFEAFGQNATGISPLRQCDFMEMAAPKLCFDNPISTLCRKHHVFLQAANQNNVLFKRIKACLDTKRRIPAC